MTADEKAKIVKVLVTADHGCSNCVANIAEKMAEVFPDDDWFNRVMREFYPDWHQKK